MTDKLTDLLLALPAPEMDRSLDGLESQVWARIEAMRSPGPVGALRYQIAAAGMALVIGAVLGWTANAPRPADQDQGLYASYAEVGPAARLSGL